MQNEPQQIAPVSAKLVSAGMMTQMRRAGEYDLGISALEVGLAAIQRIDLVNSVADRLPELVMDTGVPARADKSSEDPINRKTEGHGTGILRLRSRLQRMIAGRLDIPEPPFKPLRAIETGASGGFHRQLDRFDGMTGDKLPADNDVVHRLIAGVFRRTAASIDSGAMAVPLSAVSMGPTSAIRCEFGRRFRARQSRAERSHQPSGFNCLRTTSSAIDRTCLISEKLVFALLLKLFNG